MEPYELAAIERLTTRPPRDYRTITVHPLTPIVGGEVSGVDLSAELPAAQLDEVRTAFLDHHVLVFRDQYITDEDHKRFAGHFGSLRPVNPPPEGDPVILDIRTTAKDANSPGNGWHADGSADAEPSLGSMLYITETPQGGSGGDTMFANMNLAYEMLSPPLRELLDGLTAIHDGELPFRVYERPPNYVAPKNEHPLVVRHPDSDLKILYANSGYTARIPQLSVAESDALLKLLVALPAMVPLLSCRVRWQPNTLVFWDNRIVQHNAIYDYYPLTRYGRRVAINGGPLKA
ncbi:TauD/TfdA dioxygenase family protein [Dactylosporangium sp. CA-092794]|uniref:TauD/TfdA dioxygenase family protein n=1 Tax=Dactylosporangium sp. CA-092794 TaxID=3239929 RepID=UPI003D8AE9BF